MRSFVVGRFSWGRRIAVCVAPAVVERAWEREDRDSARLVASTAPASPGGMQFAEGGASALPLQLGGQLHSGDSGLEAAVSWFVEAHSWLIQWMVRLVWRVFVSYLHRFFAPDPRQTSLTNLGCSTRPCSQRVAAAIGDPGLVVRRGTLRVDLVDGTPSLVGVCELPTSVLRSGSSPDITDQPGVLMSELHEREVDGEEEVAERRARATDGKEAEVVAVAGRWEGLAA